MAAYWTEDPSIGNALAGLADSFSYKNIIANQVAMEELKKRRAQAAATQAQIDATNAMWNARKPPDVGTPYQTNWAASGGPGIIGAEQVPASGVLPRLQNYTTDIAQKDVARQDAVNQEFNRVREKQLADNALAARYASSASDVAGAMPKLDAFTQMALYGGPSNDTQRAVLNAQLGHELKVQDPYGKSEDNLRTIGDTDRMIANGQMPSPEQLRRTKLALDLEYGISKPHVAEGQVIPLREKLMPQAFERVDRLVNPDLYRPPAPTATPTAPPPPAPGGTAQAPGAAAPAATVTTTPGAPGGAVAAPAPTPAPAPPAQTYGRQSLVAGPSQPLAPAGAANDQQRRVATAMQQVQPERQKLEAIVGFQVQPDGKFTLSNPGGVPSYAADAINYWAGNIGYGKRLMDWAEGKEKGADNPQLREWYAAAKAWVEPVLRLASGAAINPTEYASYYSMFVPSPGDSPNVIAEKFARMRQWESAVAQSTNAGQAFAIMQQIAPQREDVEKMRVILRNNPQAAQIPFNQLVATQQPGVAGSTAVPPAQGPQRSAQDQALLDWANANPNDPRAAQVKRKLGM